MRLRLLIIAIMFFLTVGVYGEQTPILSPDSLYNMANTAYENGRYDLAIFYYENARLLDPNAGDILNNVKLAKEKLSTDIIELKPFFLMRWWKGLIHLFLPFTWKVISFFSLAILLITVFSRLLKSQLEKSRFILLVAGSSLLFVLAVLAGSARAKELFNPPYGIVFGEEQALYLGPDEVSEPVKTVTGGDKVKVLESFEDWYKVSAMDSEQGWIKQEKVRMLGF